MKKETLEEAAERYRFIWIRSNVTINQVFIAGAKWQQEQDKKMYSEEELKEAFNGFKSGKSFIEWFEQFKK